MSAILLLGAQAMASDRSFTPVGTPERAASFDDLTAGGSVEAAGWKGLPDSLQNIIATAPAAPGYEGTVLEAKGPERSGIALPYSIPQSLLKSPSLYVRGWFLRTNDHNSGGRLLLRDSSGNAVAGLGITDVKTTASTGEGNSERGRFGIFTSTQSYYSSEVAMPKHWYEVILVITQNIDDPTESKGSLFVRNATTEETDFRPVPGLSNISLLHTEKQNLTLVNNLRIEGFRANGQIGAISLGACTLHP